MSWTPAGRTAHGEPRQVYQGFYELNPSYDFEYRHSDTSISGILWVEPQQVVLRPQHNSKYIRDFMSWTPAFRPTLADRWQVYQGFYELNPSKTNTSPTVAASISGILWVEPQPFPLLANTHTKYIRDFMSWTPAFLLTKKPHHQVYQGFYELNPSIKVLSITESASISGILWVEPQL